MATPQPPRTTAFISYSHKDAKYQAQLQKHLKPLLRDGSIQVWDDTQIEVFWRITVDSVNSSLSNKHPKVT